MNRRSIFLLAAATVVCLVPWLNKAFDIDDPLFVWSAERILQDPLDFYGGDVNWYGSPMRFSDLIKNPPLLSYYLAGVGAVTGIREWSLHFAMLVPAVATILGVYFLAARLCDRPLLAAATLLATPAFLVSSTSVMCDIPMTAFWLWSLFLWRQGIEDRRQWALFAAGIGMGLCALTKYFGIAVLPLALVYATVRTRRIGTWSLALLPPIAMCLAFEYLMHAHYGSSAFLGAASYATRSVNENELSYAGRGLIALFYIGGAALPLLLLAPWLWSRTVLAAWVLTAGLTGTVLGWQGNIPTGNPQSYLLRAATGVDWLALVQCTLLIVAALNVFALVAVDFARKRDADSLLLALWVLGTFVFAAFVNWSINARSLLPAAPAIAILIARQLDRRWSGDEAHGRATSFAWCATGAGLAFSLVLCWADCRSADANRAAAKTLIARHPSRAGAPQLWFGGHWGFQYYLERGGAIPLNLAGSELHHGDVIVIPDDNPSGIAVSEEWKLVDTFTEPLVPWVATTSLELQTSFYSSVIGPVPYRVAPIPPRRFRVFDPFAPFTSGLPQKP